MTCENEAPAPLRCPTLQERINATLSLLPLGRAWGSEDGNHEIAHDAAFDDGAFDGAVFDTLTKSGTIIYRFFAAAASVLHYAETRLCSLRNEFFCATAHETVDLWLNEYDLPSVCDPFPDLCGKVAALGGARCDYYREIAARAGWSISCVESGARCRGMMYGRDKFGGRNRRMGGRGRFALILVVDINASPAYSGPRRTKPIYGRMRMGQRLSCGPSVAPLKCIMERVVHAHLPVEYVTI